MSVDVVILGPPGAGKGTQAEFISQDASIPHIATGDMIRAAIADGTQLGNEVKAIYDAGDLIPDDLMIEVIRERLSQSDTADGFVLDGFPRTEAQAEALDSMLGDLDRELSLVLDFEVSEEVAVERLLGRAREQGRSDDSPEVVRHRLEVFHQKTEPLIAYYRTRGLLVPIHADRSVGEVSAEVQQVLQTAAAE
ncbi:MAG TPA: adenylate kinase [Gaiellaceae bacterium]